MADLDGQYAVVTGAGNGIGRACALHYARNGADVAIIDVEQAALDEVAQEITDLGRNVLPLNVDCTKHEAIEAAFATIHAEFPQIDVLLNNVGQSAREKASEFWNSEFETWDWMLKLNLYAMMSCCRQVVPAMRERKSGKIVSIASESAYMGLLGVADYSAAKAGVIGLTRSLARELAPFQVTVNAVCPGPIRTRVSGRLPIWQEYIKQIPMGYAGEPEDIANAVMFFSTAGSRWCTGQSLIVNGGRWWS